MAGIFGEKERIYWGRTTLLTFIRILQNDSCYNGVC